MEQGKSITYYMRCLHRDIGFLLVGMTIIYAISGIVLVYRETDVFKTSASVSTSVPPHLSPDDLSKQLHFRRFKVTKTEGNTIYFEDGQNTKDGVYNQESGEIRYTTKQFMPVIEPLIRLHMLSSSKVAHLFSVAYGALLVFLAASSLMMFSTGSQAFRRGVSLCSAGVAVSVLVLALL